MSQIYDGYATIRKRGLPRNRPRASALPVTPPELEDSKLPTLLVHRKPPSNHNGPHENNNTHGYDRHLLRSQSCDEKNFPEDQCGRNANARLKYRNSFTFANRTIYEEGSKEAGKQEDDQLKDGGVELRYSNGGSKYVTLGRNYRGNNDASKDVFYDNKEADYSSDHSTSPHIRNGIGRFATMGRGDKRSCREFEETPGFPGSDERSNTFDELQFRNGGGRFATMGGGERRRRKDNVAFGDNQNFAEDMTRRYTVCQTDLEMLNERRELDFKVGCQTVVRSNPVVPWYDLAIRNRRSKFFGSCPVIPEAHVVSAFEQSLQNMTQRLQQLTVTAERKDSEVTEMRQTIELLRKQSVQAGLTSAHMISMGVPQNGVSAPDMGSPAHNTQGNVTCAPRPNMTRHLSTDSMSSLNSLSSSCSAQDKKKKKGWLRSSFTKAFSRNAKISKTSRHPSADGDCSSDVQGSSIPENHRSPNRSPAKTSVPQASSTPSTNGANTNGHQLTHQQVQTTPEQESIRRSEDSQLEELKKQLREKDLVLTDIRLEALTSAHQLESLKDTVIKMRTEMMNLKQNNERLQRLVTSRSLAGSEISLGGSVASSGDPRRCSATDGLALRPSMELPHYLSETDEESSNLMACDPPEPAQSPSMNGSAAVPERLDQSDQSSGTSPDQSSDTSPERDHLLSGTGGSLERDRRSMISERSHVRSGTTNAGGETEGKRIAICVYLGQPDSFLRYLDEIGALSRGGHEHYIENNHESDFYKQHQQTASGSGQEEFTIAYTRISGKTTWQNLDDVVRKTFRDYLSRVDPGSNLGLNTDSITSYHLGEAKRGPDTGLPELLPCGYIVGRVRALYICLQGVGGLAFDSLIPRSIVNRYVSLLSEHHRLILCGPRGTGKSYLARRLAEFLVARSGHANPNEAIATFHVDHKNGSAGELRQYLCHVAEIAASALAADSAGGAGEVAGPLPAVIILDDLHNAGAGALADAFAGLLAVSSGNNGENGRGALPRIIGTMSQATCNTTNLQLHHNFRWVLTANHMEPVKGFLARYLRRHVFTLELRTGIAQTELSRVLQWLPAVWTHVNRFLEAHSSSDVTLGPGMFLQCPLDVKRSQVWFTNIWNYKLSPFIVEAVREGVALYGRRGGAWQDPSVFLRETYPWDTSLTGSGSGSACGVGPGSLRRVTADDVGLASETPHGADAADGESLGHANGETQDPLSNMLMRLQEAANYSGNQSNDSDSASVDSNMTHDSSAGVD